MNKIFLRALLCLALLMVPVVRPDDAEASEGEEEEEILLPIDQTLATVKQGQLRGKKEEALNGKEFYSFRGIPYAKPPVGELRFVPPEDPVSWSDERSALNPVKGCPAVNPCSVMAVRRADIIGQEDCLYLNVFSPMPKRRKSDPLLPIMVFIHGGGYFFGHAEQYPPYRLMTEDIVLVVIQYRLGTLGFLSTEDDEAPGNLGILDQMKALDWIQQNAEAFGGNPLQITIFGESAGAASVHLQLMSHTSLGYFHRAIMQSGSALASWAMGENHLAVARFLSHIFKCGSYASAERITKCEDVKNLTAELHTSCLVEGLTSKEILQCLRSVPEKDIAETATLFMKFSTFPLLLGPRVHKNLIMKDPVVLMKENRFKKLDIMLGVTKDEGAFMTNAIFSNEGSRSAIRFDFENIAPVALDFSPGDIAVLNQTIKVLDHYVGNIDFDVKDVDNITAMFGDKLMWYPVDTTARVYAADRNMAKKGKKIFQYQFDYLGQNRLSRVFDLTFGENWVTHADELIYLFGAMDEKCNLAIPLENEEDKKVSDMMVKMWTNFAATGNPTPDDGEMPAQWTPYTSDSPDIFIIDREPKMVSSDLKKDVREFWQSLPLKLNLILFPEKIGNLVPFNTTEVPEAENEPKITLATDITKPEEDNDEKIEQPNELEKLIEQLEEPEDINDELTDKDSTAGSKDEL